MEQILRTDLAMERLSLANCSHGRGRGVEGVHHRRKTIQGIGVHVMSVETQAAADVLCKPIGMYYTISLEKTLKRVDDSFSDTAACIASILRELLPGEGSTLLVCLGNPKITSDAIGPSCADHLMVTRHLKAALPTEFAELGETTLLCPGVLGTTGIESAQLVKGAVDAVQPSAVIAIDALAARSAQRLCRTVQICNTGIAPGSGVGNARFALNEESLGVPVIAMGVPTVVDASTFIYDMTDGHTPKDGRGEGLFITPREIDSFVSDSAKLLAYGINLALHRGITLEDIDLYVS